MASKPRRPCNSAISPDLRVTAPVAIELVDAPPVRLAAGRPFPQQPGESGTRFGVGDDGGREGFGRVRVAAH